MSSTKPRRWEILQGATKTIVVDAKDCDALEARFAELEAELAALKKRIGQANEALKIQGSDGNWDASDYMHGMFNGMEFVVATIEDRETRYIENKGAPGVRWVAGAPVFTDKLEDE